MLWLKVLNLKAQILRLDKKAKLNYILPKVNIL